MFISENSIGVIASSLIARFVLPSAFTPHVIQVVSLGANEQMLWPNAIWHIAFMENLQAFGNLTNKQSVGNAVSHLGRLAFLNNEFPISEFDPTSNP